MSFIQRQVFIDYHCQIVRLHRSLSPTFFQRFMPGSLPRSFVVYRFSLQTRTFCFARLGFEGSGGGISYSASSLFSRKEFLSLYITAITFVIL